MATIRQLLEASKGSKPDNLGWGKAVGPRGVIAAIHPKHGWKYFPHKEEDYGVDDGDGYNRARKAALKRRHDFINSENKKSGEVNSYKHLTARGGTVSYRDDNPKYGRRRPAPDDKYHG